MTKAIVKKEFPGRADGATTTRTFKPGEQIEGNLASVAIANGWAAEEKAEKSAKSGAK